MNVFQKIKPNITRCTFIPEGKESVSNHSYFVDSKYMDGETISECPISVVDVRFTPRDIYQYVTHGEPIIKIQKTVDGQRTYIENLTKEFQRTAFRAQIAIHLNDGEHIYGLGQDEDGIYNKRGRIEYLYHLNMKIPMPMFVSSDGYGVLFNSGCLMVFDDTDDNTIITLECVDQIDFFVIEGTMDEIVDGYRLLTGKASPMPNWAFGYIQSKERYQTQDELLEVAGKFRDLEIPIDVLVQDWKTWVGDLWGDKILDKERYPDIKGAMEQLHKQNIHALVSVWPNMNTGGENHAEFAKKGLLLNDYSTYDAFDDEGRKVYWQQAEKELYSGGFDGWWCDSTEPFTAPDWGGETKLTEPTRYEIVGGEHEKYLDPATANLYGLVHAKGMYEHQPDKPVVNLTRAGYAGVQKYGTILWAGDTCATWDDLRKDIVKGLSISMCGIPYWTVDAGAFFVGGTESWRKWKGDPDAAPVWFWNGHYNKGVHDKAYQELYTRWLQFACFLSIFRSHGTDTPREPWQFEQPFYDVILKTIQLRYRLMPYILDMAKRVTEENYTIVRSLLFDFPNDKNAKTIENQFMFGDAILVCPIYKPYYYTVNSEPIENPETTWECYLPKGADWYDYWDRTYYKGGQTISVDVSLDKIPLFVRAGTRLPTQNGLQHVGQFEDIPVVSEEFPTV